ncbi:hypothetical protein JCM1840_006047 [Sporobolomyces johnsonii]
MSRFPYTGFRGYGTTSSISELSVTLHHRPGHRQGKTDALSRRADYAKGAKASEGKPVLFFPPSRIAANHLFSEPWPNFTELVAAGQAQDDDIRQVLQDRQLDENADDHDTRWTVDDQGLLRWDDRVYVPDIDKLRLRAVQLSHDDPAASHLGVDKTLQRLRRSLYFPQEHKYVTNFVNTCDTCFRNKSRRSKAHGLLQPLPAPSRPWSSIALDFIVKLPTTPHGNDSILVVIDRFTRYAHFILCREAGTDSARFAQLFYRYIFGNHGLPDDVVSDRGAVFDSNFWRTLSRLTRTKLSMSTAYHPQSDGITERLNQTLEQYLRMYINYQQDDWEDLLPLAQYVYNDTLHSSTKTTPFFATYGFHPTFAVSFEDSSNEHRDADATSFAARLATLHQVLRHELGLAAQRMKTAYDRHRLEAPRFDIDDLVWLSSKNIATSRQSQKLDHRFLGPYPIVEKIGDSAYRLKLPDTVRLHDVFHTPPTPSLTAFPLPLHSPSSTGSPNSRSRRFSTAKRTTGRCAISYVGGASPPEKILGNRLTTLRTPTISSKNSTADTRTSPPPQPSAGALVLAKRGRTPISSSKLEILHLRAYIPTSALTSPLPLSLTPTDSPLAPSPHRLPRPPFPAHRRSP